MGRLCETFDSCDIGRRVCENTEDATACDRLGCEAWECCLCNGDITIQQGLEQSLFCNVLCSVGYNVIFLVWSMALLA